MLDGDGKVTGVKYCCCHCRSNRFTSCTGHTITNASEVKRNGVRVVASVDGFICPNGQVITCRNSLCPPNARKLANRKLSWPDASKALPARAKAPDGKEWPETDISTTSPTYVKMLNELVPSVGCHYTRFALLSTGGCDTSMAAKLLDTSQTHAAIRRDLLTSAKERERLALTRYALFASEDQYRVYTTSAAAPAPCYMPTSPSAVRNPMLAAWLQRPQPREPAEAQPAQDGAVATDQVAVSVLDKVATDAEPLAPVSPSPSRRLSFGATVAGWANALSSIMASPTQSAVDAPPADADQTGDAEELGDLEPMQLGDDDVISGLDEQDFQQELSAASTSLSAAQFPAWRFVHGAATIVTLSDANLKTWTRNVHEKVRPYLLADLLTRHPGEVASSDHTFRMAARATGDAAAYCFFMGEDHSIYWYGGTETTKWEELYPALVGCEQRFVRLGVSGQLK